MIRLAAIDHVVFRVRDMARMVTFYEDVLGARIERRVDDIGLIQLRAGSALVDLVDCAGSLGRAGGPPAAGTGGNVDHVCFRVEPWDEQALLAYLAAHGCGDLQVERRYGEQGFGPSIYISDPEGNRIELKGPSETGCVGE